MQPVESSEHVEPEQSHDANDLTKRLPQDSNQWSPFADVELVDYYLQKKIHILVRFVRRGVDEELTALLERESAFERDKSISEHLFDVRRRFAVIKPSPEVEPRERCVSGDHEVMLVPFVKFMEPPQNIIPSMVWIETSDFIDDRLTSALYFSIKRGLDLVGRRSLLEDWEISVLGRSGNKSAGQVVERSAEILDCVPGNGANGKRHRVDPIHVVNDLAGLNLWLSNDFIRVSTLETLKRGTIVRDVLFGPLDLCTDGMK